MLLLFLSLPLSLSLVCSNNDNLKSTEYGTTVVPGTPIILPVDRKDFQIQLAEKGIDSMCPIRDQIVEWNRQELLSTILESIHPYLKFVRDREL